MEQAQQLLAAMLDGGDAPGSAADARRRGQGPRRARSARFAEDVAPADAGIAKSPRGRWAARRSKMAPAAALGSAVQTEENELSPALALEIGGSTLAAPEASARSTATSCPPVRGPARWGPKPRSPEGTAPSPSSPQRAATGRDPAAGPAKPKGLQAVNGIQALKIF